MERPDGKGRTLRRRLTGGAAVIAGVSAAAAAIAFPALFAGTVSATTGDTYVLPPSQYVVPQPVASHYYGSYRMSGAGKGSRLSAADIFITRNQYHDLYGGGSFFGYDAAGQQDSWTNLLYDFHLVPPAGGEPVMPWTSDRQSANDELVITLFGWGSPSLGTMSLKLSRNGDLRGTIHLLNQKSPYPISFHRLSSHP